MTSSRLFFNMLRGNIRRQMWSVVVLCVIWFFFFPVFSAMGAEKTVAFLYDFCRSYGAGSSTLMVITVFAAFILAISSFKHLHSSRMTDCYHALPIKRGWLFASQYVSGIIIYFGTYLLGIVSALIVVATKGVMIKYLLPNICYAYFYYLLVFLMFYTIAVIAVELTGKLLTGVLGTLYLSAYAVAVCGLVSTMQEVFFEHYSFRSQQDIFEVTRWISPFSRLYLNYEWLGTRPENCIFRASGIWQDQPQLLERIEGTTMVVTMLPASVIIGMIIMIAVLIAAAVVLFLKRRSESAGNAMAFAISRPIVKFLTVLPAGALLGIFFCAMNSQESLAWLMFGTVCGAVLTCCGIEVIFQADIRAIFRKKHELLISIVAAVLVVCFFRFDWGGYDTYLPKKDDLESVSIVFDFDYAESRKDLTSPYMEYDKDYQFEKEGYRDIDTIYPLLQYLVTEDGEEADDFVMMSERAMDMELGYSADIVYSYADKYVYGSMLHTVTVGYHLDNGRTVYREYYMSFNDEKLCELINAVYVTEEYKTMHHAICRDEIMAYMAGVRLEGKLDSALSTDTAKNREFLEIYRREYLEHSFYDLLDSEVVYTIDFLIDPERKVIQEKEFNSLDYDYMDHVTYPVYETFTESLAWLEENLKLEEDGEFHEKIDWMTVYDQLTGEVYEFQKNFDAKIIEQLYADMITENQYVINRDYRYFVEMYATAVVENANGRLEEQGRYFSGYLMDDREIVLPKENLKKY